MQNSKCKQDVRLTARRRTCMIRVLTVASLIALGAISVSAQKTAEYHAPRTPWGDPDLQGNYTNLSEAGTPMERPAEYIGKNMNEFSREELTEIKKKLAARTINA